MSQTQLNSSVRLTCRLNEVAEAKVVYLAEEWWDTVVNRVSANLANKKHV